MRSQRAATTRRNIARYAPRDIGDADPAFWKPLTDDQQNQAIAQLKAFARQASDTLKHPLRLKETKFFLYYSDLSESESDRYAGLLERMYARLCDLFGLQKGENVWRGKALVFVFSHVEDYRLFERLVENTDPGGSFAMTHCFGDGMVHTAFDRHPNAAMFEHLLVHECVHGFLHRYRSPDRIPSWANEGLADAAAAEVVPDPARSRLMLTLARTGIEKHNNGVADFFTTRHIDGWQYPVAETLTAWMIHQNRQGYLSFMNGIKEGETCDRSLKENFGLTQMQLLSDYETSLKPK